MAAARICIWPISAGDREGSPLRFYTYTSRFTPTSHQKLIEMRLLTLLATTVLLAGCVHDTDDFNLFLAESGVSLTYYIGSGSGADQKNHDDPWDTINENYGVDTVHAGKKKDGSNNEHDDPWDTIGEKFGAESVHTGKSGHDDPWDVIGQSFPLKSVHTGKSGEEDPWNRINGLFPAESVHSGKTNDRLYFGIEKSRAVFLSFSYRVPTTYRAQVMEVRGRVARLEFADGVEQYVIDAPASWTEGAQLETGFWEATTKKDRPFLGVRFWRSVEGSAWETQSRNLASELPAAWPSEYHASGASLLVGLSVGQKSHDDPWNRISELFPDEPTYMGKSVDDPWNTIKTRFSGAGKNGEEHDDPWDTIHDNFSQETTHTGSGKAHDDPWDTINEKFPLESTHTGERKRRSFRGKPVVEMLFVSVGGEKGGEEDPWDRIGDLFPKERSGGVRLKLAEVRDQVGRFTFVSPSDGESLGEQSVFAVGVPADWEPGLVLRGEAYLLDTKKMLPLMGAVIWEVDPILR